MPTVRVLPARGFATGMDEFRSWADDRGGRRLLMEDHYRLARRRLDVLMDGDEPTGGRWNFDADNRRPPPKGKGGLGVPEPWWPVEDEIDDEVRFDLDRWERDGDVSFIGADGPRRFSATGTEASARLDHFIGHRLPAFGPYEDAMLAGDRWMSHSLISASLNLGLLDPLDVVRRVETAYRAGDVPISSAEGFVRQVIGWRDYVWNLYWYLGPGLPEAQRSRRRPGTPPLVRRTRRRRGAGAVPVVGAGRRPRPRLGASHPAADGAGQLRDAAGLATRAGDGLVPSRLHRRLRLGDGAERDRHVAVRGRRPDHHQALRRRRRLHRPDERLLRRLRLPAVGPGR